jgi:uncharacterized surface protein with fasciclin (FAS1) repeats
MQQTTASRALGIAALGLTMSCGLAACGGGASSTTATASSAPTSVSPSVAAGTASTTAAGAGTFGPGCSAVPTAGDGSFDGMATAPVASATAANPLLRSLGSALTKADLADELDSADALTVLAPTDDAFAEIPTPQLNALLADRTALARLLSHHVIEGRLAPDQLAGRHDTLAGDTVTIAGSGEDFTVSADDAHILCGNIPTANATVYMIDTVLMPAG